MTALNKRQAAEPTHDPDRWMVRSSTTALNTMKETKSIRCTYELVWGHWVFPRGSNGNPKIVGESYHELHGPTAEASLLSYAEDLNMRKVQPSEMPKCVADGCKIPRNDPNQLGFAMMIEPEFKRQQK